MPDTLLLIAKNWPEPQSTAAGRRTLDLLTLFANMGYQIHIASAAEQTPFQAEYLDFTAQLHAIAVNDDQFDAWLIKLHPDVVIFDRYVMEEQFGWRVREYQPQALTLLDTSDLHCLRQAREAAFKKNAELNLFNEVAIREITSIARCDLTLMISQVEIEILKQEFQLTEQILAYLPFLVHANEFVAGPGYNQRKHLMMIGGFKHEPNRDATRWLKQEIWPLIRKQLPKEVEMHVYGGYADHAINQLHNPAERFFIGGRVEDAIATLHQHRVNLAPLRFGAGQKGKILEGWLSGTPTVTTSIGYESMAEPRQLGYSASDNAEQFAATAVKLYQQEAAWQKVQQAGFDRLNEHFLHEHHASAFQQRVQELRQNLDEHRQANFWGRVLWSTQFRATEYMSRWITLKNNQAAPKQE